MEFLTSTISALQLNDDGTVLPDHQRHLTLLDLPSEIHLKIIEQCLLDAPRKLELEWTPLGRHTRRDDRKLLGGSLRDLTFLNHYFRQLTAPYLFENICISDDSKATKEDKLRENHQYLMSLPAYKWLQHMKKFTISLGRTPNPHQAYAGDDFIHMLNYMQWPTIMRYVLETQHVTYTILNDVRHILLKYRRHGWGFEVFKVRQLELSCPWGSHRWDFQFLTWPYLNTERIWLDFNTDHLKPQSLALERLRNLEYVMHRAHPVRFFDTGLEREQFQGFIALDGRRPPFLRQLGNTMKHVKHLALCGVLKGPVTEVAPLLRDMRSLEQLNITTQQAITEEDIHRIDKMLHPYPEIDWAIKHSRLIRAHRHNIHPVKAATVFFETLPSLKRICLVQDQIGVVYQAVRDEETGALERMEEVETIKERFRYLKYSTNTAVWRCGFPNKLDYKLWDRLEGCSWCTTEEAYWLNPAWQAGDRNVVPQTLRFDVAERAQYGVMSPEATEMIARLDANIEERHRRDAERKTRNAFIRNQRPSTRAHRG